VQKARTAIFFSAANGIFSGTPTGATTGRNAAFSARTVGFYLKVCIHPASAARRPAFFSGCRKNFPSSRRFPCRRTIPSRRGVHDLDEREWKPAERRDNLSRRFPLYRNGVLIGAVGVSGDGVDQDDLISASGAALFLAPVAIRADQTQYRGALLPFAKFPRNPAM